MPNSADVRTGRIQAGGWVAWWLVPAIYVACGLAFLGDLFRDNTLAFGVVYVPLVATALLHRRRWGLWVLTALSTVLVVAGAFFPAIASDLPDLIGNRVLSVLAILATSAFVYHARGMQDRLASQTHRAETAEDIKTEVLNNLTREMQPPLRSLTGLLNLMMANCRPDQREALRHVRDGGQQLLMTIDNLIDLTRLDERQLSLRTTDIAAIIRDSIAAIHPIADERGLKIILDQALRDDDQPIDVMADPWAVRRILDNLLSNAIRVTPPDGTISLSVRRQNRVVTVAVSDTGMGLPPGLMAFAQDDGMTPGASLPPVGSGLTLSHRLARGMNGTLLLANQPDSGASVSLSLPAAGQLSVEVNGATKAA